MKTSIYNIYSQKMKREMIQHRKDTTEKWYNREMIRQRNDTTENESGKSLHWKPLSKDIMIQMSM